MKRVLALLLLPLLSVLGGCATILGTGDWDAVKATYLGGADAGDYSLAATPDDVSVVVDGNASTHDLPAGAWQALTTGLRALGEHTADNCPDGSMITIQAYAGGTVKQTFEASSCDADGVYDTARQLIEQVINQLK